MFICPNCGEEIYNDSARVCPHCGSDHETGWNPDADYLSVELPEDEDIHVFCRSGQRSWYATRILLQNGFRARNISGGMLARTYSSFFIRERTEDLLL